MKIFLALHLQPPPFFEKFLAPPSDIVTREYMRRHMLSYENVMEHAWKIFILGIIVGMLLFLFIFIFVGILEGLLAAIVALILPFLLSSHICNGPKKLATREQKAFLRQAPAVIGSLAMSMTLTPSLDKAVFFAASINRGELGKRLSLVSWEVLTRCRDDVESSLTIFISSLSSINQALKHSLHLIMASTYEPTKEGMERLMDKAHEISVQGLKQIVERYVSSLSTQVMILYALGILLPIILISMTPLMAISTPIPYDKNYVDVISMPRFPITALAFLLLIVIPTFSFYYSYSILEISPLSNLTISFNNIRWEDLVPWIAVLILIGFMIIIEIAISYPEIFLIALSILISFSLWKKKPLPKKIKLMDVRREYISGLYQIGIRLSSGAGIEKALIEAAESSPGTHFERWIKEILYAMKISRISLLEAIENRNKIEDWPLIYEAFRTVVNCALSDSVSAGRVAVRLAKSLSDIEDCEFEIVEKTRPIMDMMQNTAMFFAPIVLGLTIGMLSLTSGLIVYEDLRAKMIIIAGVYIIELCIIVAFFSTFLTQEGNWQHMAQWLTKRMPIAILVFTLISLSSFAGFSLL
ncbi:MAG: hypothetical protein QW520_06835 [Methanomassiliicoccales archaeon]